MLISHETDVDSSLLCNNIIHCFNIETVYKNRGNYVSKRDKTHQGIYIKESSTVDSRQLGSI